jgi:hypothetical protein
MRVYFAFSSRGPHCKFGHYIRGISRLLLEIEQWPAELAMGLRGAQFRISIPIENINFSLLNNMLGGREREREIWWTWCFGEEKKRKDPHLTRYWVRAQSSLLLPRRPTDFAGKVIFCR